MVRIIPLTVLGAALFAVGAALAADPAPPAAGAVTGEGRLEKIGRKPKSAGAPQAV